MLTCSGNSPYVRMLLIDWPDRMVFQVVHHYPPHRHAFLHLRLHFGPASNIRFSGPANGSWYFVSVEAESTEIATLRPNRKCLVGDNSLDVS